MVRLKRMAVLAMAGLCGCTPPTPESKVVTLGGVVDRTGPLALPSTDAIMNLAIDRMNAGLTKSKFKSMQFNFVFSDDAQNNPAVAADRAVDLILNQGAKTVITDASAVSTAINRLMYDEDPANDINVPIMGMSNNAGNINNPNATDPDPITQNALHNGLKWNFRTTMSGNIQTGITARAGLALAAQQHGTANEQYKVDTYGVDDAFGRGGAAGTKGAMSANHPSPLPTYESLYQAPGVDPSTYNYAADIARLVDTSNESTTPATTDGAPDVIVETLSPVYAIAFTREYALLGNTIPLLHTAGFQTKNTLDQLGDQANGQVAVATTAADGQSGTEFNDLFKATPGGYPGQNRESMLYDAAMTLMLATVYAVHNNDLADPTLVTGAQIRDALFKINEPGGAVITAGSDLSHAVDLIVAGLPINYEGASGPVDFDAYGNVVQRVSFYRVENRQWLEVNRYDCVAQPTGAGNCPKLF